MSRFALFIVFLAFLFRSRDSIPLSAPDQRSQSYKSLLKFAASSNLLQDDVLTSTNPDQVLLGLILATEL